MPRDEHGVLALDAERGERALDRREDRVVTAARAPADVLVGLEVLLRELELDCFAHAFLTRSTWMLSGRRGGAPCAATRAACRSPRSTSRTLNGWPWILLRPTASIEELGADHRAELAHVELGDDHVLEVVDDLREAGLERRQPAQVRVADLLALRGERLLRLAERAERAAPADHEHVAGLVGPDEVELADVLRDALDLLGADFVCFSWFSGAYEMLPVSASFSMPPMRCSRPGVPGTTHARASVRRIALVDEVAVGSVRCMTSKRGSAARFGSGHGSEPFAM